jgi:hypothetical protein
MKNYEKHEEELKETYVALQKGNINQLLKVYPFTNVYELIRWANEEYVEPIKLSNIEFELLECFKNHAKHLKWIARDRNNLLCLYKVKPEKIIDEGFFETKGFSYFPLELFDNYFKFIKWEDKEPYNIKEILDNCEVE